MRKKTLIYILMAFVVAFVVSKLTQYYTDSNTPSFLSKLVSTSKNDEELMKKIGGYSSFEHTFNKNELKTDTLHFNVTIHGHSKKLIYNGCAVKMNEQDWKVQNIKKVIE